MRVIIRADSSEAIGTGHVMRCLTLADHLRQTGNAVSFVCRELPGNIISAVEAKNFPVKRLPFGDPRIMHDSGRTEYERWLAVPAEVDLVQTRNILTEMSECIDWLIIDHYALSARWESRMRPHAGSILVIDDLADRSHEADIVLDANVYTGADNRYRGIVPASCRVLEGPEYALLRPEFTRLHWVTSPRHGSVRNLLVFYGGADLTGETEKALGALRDLAGEDLKIKVIVGAANSRHDKILSLCAGDSRISCLRSVDNMAELMADSDLCLGAAGTTTWERCCLGLPTLTTAVAENQVPIGREADRAGLLRYLGSNDEVSQDMLIQAINEALSQPEVLRNMSVRAMEAVDGEGAGRVVGIMREKAFEEIAL